MVISLSFGYLINTLLVSDWKFNTKLNDVNTSIKIFSK